MIDETRRIGVEMRARDTLYCIADFIWLNERESLHKSGKNIIYISVWMYK